MQMHVYIMIKYKMSIFFFNFACSIRILYFFFSARFKIYLIRQFEAYSNSFLSAFKAKMYIIHHFQPYAILSISAYKFYLMRQFEAYTFISLLQPHQRNI